ncbi:MAG: SDR family NAD(P)-dependent oxidoreductase [Micavibrio aeruginosavorus]|uniref:SDR family NAD(P)-dependent oxidoreductase n=1 Tax=Micavibrio aeruginosavorus TaxID=349221 RepID=A0A7T5R0D0_9BACT|nr:MAG: SDR family NAD(P)-dependent oxidoreductase [Micavibrio aeruginosavorus]
MTNPLGAIAPYADVSDMTIAITGGATGLGRSVVDALAHLHVRKLIVIDIRDDIFPELKAKYGDKVETIAFNLATAQDADYVSLAGKVSQAAIDPADGKPHLDVFFGNAGILKATAKKPYEATKDFDLAELHASFNVNAAANAMMFKLLKPLLESSQGRFVFTTSPTSGRTADTKYPSYGSSKAYQEQFMGCLAAGNPEVPVLAFDPGRLDATGVRAEAYPQEVPGAQPGPSDILEPLLLLMARDTDIANLRGHVVQVNNVEDIDVKGRRVNKRVKEADGSEGFAVIIKKRPLASRPGEGDVVSCFVTSHSRALVGADPLPPYDPNGKTLGEIYGLPSEQIGNKMAPV